MLEVIITPTKNGAENIRLSRLAVRKANLAPDREAWRTLAKTPCSRQHRVYKTKISKNGSTRNIVNHDYDDAMEVGSTITKRIMRYWADDYGIGLEEQVEPWMIAEIANMYLNLPERMQLMVCRDPSRQTIDEEVQKATLTNYLLECTVEKPTNGSLTLINGALIKKPKGEKNANGARSIDFVIRKNSIEFYVFAKYAAVAGSAQQAQMEESERFIQEACAYTNKNNDGKNFIVLTDGAWGESHLPSMNALVQNYPNIFAGNCESVIDFISAK
jgi:hypothetical protein